ncbi:MAG: hypothetical protein F6J97_00755 [Leptolyngbya sp. SIO4C1]|nr:hypothetical protein [Leptolyngbya sp. SIO4C1]
MFKSSNRASNSLESLVRTALSHGELSPGAAAEINRYRTGGRLSAEEQRYLAILEDAIADGCIRLVSRSTGEMTQSSARLKA